MDEIDRQSVVVDARSPAFAASAVLAALAGFFLLHPVAGGRLIYDPASLTKADCGSQNERNSHGLVLALDAVPIDVHVPLSTFHMSPYIYIYIYTYSVVTKRRTRSKLVRARLSKTEEKKKGKDK